MTEHKCFRCEQIISDLTRERDQLRWMVKSNIDLDGLLGERDAAWAAVEATTVERDEARSQREALWMLLDHIDTLDDACIARVRQALQELGLGSKI